MDIYDWLLIGIIFGPCVIIGVIIGIVSAKHANQEFTAPEKFRARKKRIEKRRSYVAPVFDFFASVVNLIFFGSGNVSGGAPSSPSPASESKRPLTPPVIPANPPLGTSTINNINYDLPGEPRYYEITNDGRSIHVTPRW